MKVSTLIEKLSTLPPDALVWWQAPDSCEPIECVNMYAGVQMYNAATKEPDGIYDMVVLAS